MKIAHASDIHGAWRKVLDFDGVPDVWLFTGDMFPNYGRPIIPAQEIEYQMAWWAKFKDVIVAHLKGKPVITVGGNHDFVNLGNLLRAEGVECYDVTPEGVDVLGFKWAGFGEIPYIAGEWVGETHDFSDLVSRTFETNPDFLVTHAPPAGIMDENGYGVVPLYTGLNYRPHQIKAHFFGHCHDEGGGHEREIDIDFYNGATNVRMIKVNA